jgi:hypothetical protein
MNQQRINAFKIGKDHQLFDRRIVTNIAIFVRIFIPPLFRSFAEQ